ncbi:MAG: hypothetical protein DCF29_10105 [Alphaproteobacteria bacterium]|nr:MAG: hypothetical protein DCF29_10105 [Alphaproteobacteria bacterium]
MSTPDDVPTFAPLVVHSRGQIVGALIARRHDLGLRGEDLDARIGWCDRYTGKVERPNRPEGRPSFKFDAPCEVMPTGDIRPTGLSDFWLEALGVRLVLVDARTADTIGAVPAPPHIAPIERLGTTTGDTTAAHRERRKQNGKQSAIMIEAYTVADRTHIAALSFKVAVTDHPFVEMRPDLKAKAEAIESQLADLADLVREAA